MYRAAGPCSSPPKKKKIPFGVRGGGGCCFFSRFPPPGEWFFFFFPRHFDIGIDVEQVRRDFDLDAIARRFFSAHEQSQLAALPADERVEGFFRCWTRKEAYIKATGDGLSLPLSQFDVSLVAEETNALRATRPDAAEVGRWLLREVPGGHGYIAALCARGQEWKLSGWSE